MKAVIPKLHLGTGTGQWVRVAREPDYNQWTLVISPRSVTPSITLFNAFASKLTIP